MSWKLDQSRAEFRCDGWSGDFDLMNPQQGLQILSPDASKHTDVLGVAFIKPHQPVQEDCYIRQGDLVVAYPPREARTFQVQLDYRILESTSNSLLIELWISIQTFLLDSQPVVSVRCSIDPASIEYYREDRAGELLVDELQSEYLQRTRSSKVQKHAAICGRGPNQNLYIAWFNHPRDQFDTAWDLNESSNRIDARLFGHFMEKGVIRRARMRCYISLSSLNLTCLQEIYQAFVASPLPLTA